MKLEEAVAVGKTFTTGNKVSVRHASRMLLDFFGLSDFHGAGSPKVPFRAFLKS